VGYLWRRLPVPVIAAAHGVCLGGGLQIALGADVRVAAPGTRFSVMEAKWGLVPDMSATVTLPGLVPRDVAKELAMTGRVFGAAEALEMGLVTRVAEDPLAEAQRLAAEIAARSPDSAAAAKRLLDAAYDEAHWGGGGDGGGGGGGDGGGGGGGGGEGGLAPAASADAGERRNLRRETEVQRHLLGRWNALAATAKGLGVPELLRPSFHARDGVWAGECDARAEAAVEAMLVAAGSEGGGDCGVDGVDGGGGEDSSSSSSSSSAPAVSRESILAGSLRAANPGAPLLNFSPGPTSLPPAVMREVQAELLDFEGCGLGVMELSHRSPEFLAILARARASLRRVLNVPENFSILFTHGGGHGQMAAVPLNLCGGGGGGGGGVSRASYIVSGTWSQRAAAEARKYADVCVLSDTGASGFDRISFEWEQGGEGEQEGRPSAYTWVCSNETVNGLELHRLGDLARALPAGSGPLVVDASSDIGTKPVDWEHVGVLFACAPKNLGHPGLTMVIVRDDLLPGEGAAQAQCPGVLDWGIAARSDCLWNTPATFNIYTTGLVLEWVERQGGVAEMERRAVTKADAVYGAIDQSGGVFSTPASEHAQRSRQNVPFDVCGGDAAATERFLLGAHARNMVGLRTNTPFGFGAHLRASLYTAVEVQHAQALAAYMAEFAVSESERQGSRP
jgi:phosphoserine aminotransferase